MCDAIVSFAYFVANSATLCRRSELFGEIVSPMLNLSATADLDVGENSGY